MTRRALILRAMSFKRRNLGLAAGYRSGLEETVAAQIKAVTGSVEYEQSKIRYTKPERTATYTPDFVLPNGIIVETKGRFLTADRQKHLLIQEQYPEVDLRFVFTNPATRISKTSKTTYASWCDAHGFLYAKKEVPAAWFKESHK